MSKECRDIRELHPKLQELAQKLVDECQRQGINLKIGETYRTVERQDYLYAQGRTRPGSIITNAKGSGMSSYHQWRLAFDVFINEKGNEYNSQLLARAGAIGQKLGLEWGGSWSGFKDTPHFQYTYGLSIPDLKSGKKPPEYKPVTADEEYKKAVTILAREININDAAWYPTPNIKNLVALIQNLGRKLYGISDYKFIIARMKQQGIISNDVIWLEHQYNENHIKSLIKKVVKYL